MAENAVADQETSADDFEAFGGDEEAAYDYPYEVSDAGPSLKKVTVTVPKVRYDEKSEEVFGEIRSDAVLPGFRRGRAPRHVVEKKFAKSVGEQVHQDLLRESYQGTLSKSGLKPLGEPEFENPEGLVPPTDGDLVYSFTVEVRPEFEVPSVEGLVIKKPRITIKDEHVAQALENLKNQQGTLGPVEGRGVKENDYVFADVVVTLEGEPVAEQKNAQLVARGGRIAGIMVADFAAKVEGAKPGDVKTFELFVPDDYPNDKLRGKTADVAVTVNDIRELIPATIDEAFLEEMGFEDLDELNDALREQMEEKVNSDVKNMMRRQVRDHLAAHVEFDLPERLTRGQTDRVINRRAMNLLQRGVSEDRVRAAVDKLREGADAEAKAELKAFFILDKLAEDQAIEVDEAEVNGQIAQLAMERDQRPETLRKQMQKDGSFQNLALAMRETKALDALLEQATIEEVDATAKEEQQAVDEATGRADDEQQDVT